MKNAPTGPCPECGHTAMVLATDVTQTLYQPMRWDSGRWMPIHTSNLEQNANTPARFFCSSCGTYYCLPKELE